MHQHLVEDLRLLELAAQLARDRAHHRVEHLGQPRVRRDLLVRVRQRVVGGEGVEVVEQPPRLVLLDVQAGQPQQPPRVVAGVDDLGLDLHAVAVDVGLHLELGDVEPQLVEPADPCVDPVPLTGRGRPRAR